MPEDKQTPEPRGEEAPSRGGREGGNGILTWEPGHADGRAQDGPAADPATDGRPRGGEGRGDARGSGPGARTGTGAAADGARVSAGPSSTGVRAPARGPGELSEPARTMVATHTSSSPPDLGPVRDRLDANRAVIDAVLGTGTSFDVIYREFVFGGTRVGTYVINGYFETIDNIEILRSLEWLGEGQSAEGGGRGARRSEDGRAGPVERDQEDGAAGAAGAGEAAEDAARKLRALVQRHLTYSQVTTTTDLNQLVFYITSGTMGFLVDGAAQGIIADTRFYPDRMPTEPDTERVIRGPHDGFVENLINNTALVRRRIRDPRLRHEIHHIGARGQTDVVLAYIEGLTDPGIVATLRRRLKAIDVDGVPMAEHQVGSFLTRQRWNPLPTLRYTERPDVTAFHLLEGHAVVLVDTTPQAIIAPSTFWNHLDHPEDYHMAQPIGTYMLWVQYMGLLASVILAPLWLAFSLDPRLVHALPGLSFIGPRKLGGFPLGLQMLGAEVALDLLRRAILNTPGSLSQTMGILGAIVLGDVAAKAGVFSSEVLVYIVLAAIGQFAISSIELGMAARLARLSLLIGVWAFRFPGLLVALTLWIILLLATRTFGIPYLWPLIPFNWDAFRGMIYRQSVMDRITRPRALVPLDPTRD